MNIQKYWKKYTTKISRKNISENSVLWKLARFRYDPPNLVESFLNIHRNINTQKYNIGAIYNKYWKIYRLRFCYENLVESFYNIHRNINTQKYWKTIYKNIEKLSRLSFWKFLVYYPLGEFSENPVLFILAPILLWSAPNLVESFL